MRFIRYFLVAVLFLLAGIIYSREVPKIKVWLLNKIQIVSREKADFEIKAKNINFHFFPPGVELISLSAAPRGEVSKVISPISADSLGLFLSPASLIAGRFEIGNITLEHPIASIFVKKGLQKTSNGSGEGQSDPFDQFINIPLKGVSISHAEIRARIEQADLALQLKEFSFHMEKTYKAAKADVFAPDLMVKKISVADSLANLGLATRIILERNAIEVSALKVTQGANYVMAAGVGHGDVVKLDFPFVNGRTMAHVNLAEIEKLVKLFVPSLNLPQIVGTLNLEVTAQQERGHDPRFLGEVDAKDMRVGKFKIGDVKTRLVYFSDTLTSKAVFLSSDAGKAKIEDLEIKNGKELKVSGRTIVEKIELRQLLENLDVHAPIHLDVTATIPCEGTITPLLRIECAGEVKGSDFLVYTKQKHKTIVALKNFKIAANMIVEKERVNFPKGLLYVGNSEGVANGQVDYDKGFSFYYHTDKLDFADVASLADLKYVGGMAVTGTTSGTGHVGVVDLQASTPSFWFENYGLGAVAMGAHYADGFLKFTDIKGQLGVTQYSGNALILVDDDAGDHQIGIKSANLNLPVMDLADIQTVFARKVALPFTMNGPGQGSLEVSGPFSLSELTYKLRGEAHRGMLAGESFSDARFDLHGVKGHAYADNIFVKKGEGLLVLTGDVQSTGDMNVGIKGHNLRLVDSEHAKTYAAGLDGRVSLDVTMKEFILEPRTTLRGTLTQTTLNQQLLDDSDFEMTFNPGSLTLDGQLFAKRLTAHLVYPFKENEPFAFKFDTTNWDFTSFLGVTGKTSITRDYETALSAKIDLSSTEGGFWKSHGTALVSKLYIRHGTSQMKNVGPLDLRFDDGNITVNQFKIEGDNTQLVVTGNKNKKDTLNFNINGRVDLSLVTFLTPFLREMTGEISLSTQVGGTLYHPDLLGSAFLKRGYFKLEALAQPFEDVSADFLFSQQKILVNRMAGHMGGGNLSAGGGITFKGLGDIPVELTGDLYGTNLTIPEGLQTRGDFHFVITGSWFPYLLKGDYNIDGGLLTKNFEDESSDTALKRSAFLPKLILQKEFTPVEVDIFSHFHKGVRVTNSAMDADMKGDLEIKGDPTHAVFKGDVEGVPGGKIFFNDTAFILSDCKVKFNNPTENNPNIYAAASTHVRDWDINLLFQGNKTKYKLELASSPPLPEKSIISLLALGVTEEDEVKTTQKQVFSTTFGAAPGSSTPNQSTDVNQRDLGQASALLGKKIQPINELKKKTGIYVKFSNTVDETLNVVMPTVTAEKVWSPKVSTTVSHTLGDHVTNDVKAEYKLNRHLSLLGSYEGRDPNYYNTGLTNPGGQSSNLPTNIFGLDLQYQLEFK